MAERYRFKGRFISASKARSLSNLRGVKKHVSTERTDREHKTVRKFKGYREPAKVAVKKAIAADREAERRKIAEAKKWERILKEKERIKKREIEQASRLAEKAAIRAIEKDLTPEDAADRYADRIEGFEWVMPEDFIQMIRDAIERIYAGVAELEFDVVDIEKPDYKSKR